MQLLFSANEYLTTCDFDAFNGCSLRIAIHLMVRNWRSDEWILIWILIRCHRTLCFVLDLVRIYKEEGMGDKVDRMRTNAVNRGSGRWWVCSAFVPNEVKRIECLQGSRCSQSESIYQILKWTRTTVQD